MDLATYVSGFSENLRDPIVEEITKAKLIQKAIQTDAGKVIINTAIDSIHQKVMGIIGCCAAEKDSLTKKIAKIEYYVNEIIVTYNLIRDWADIIENGKKHDEAMK